MAVKDVSFWCIVLVIITAMAIHHILSKDLIEGQTNMEVTIGLRDSAMIELEELSEKKEEVIRLKKEIDELKSNYKKSEEIQHSIQSEAVIIDIGEEVDVDVEGDEEEEEEEEEAEILLPIDHKEYSYNFTTCGRIGKDPPTAGECNSDLIDVNNEAWFNNKNIYDYDDNKGIHKWTVPKTGSYTIEAGGASGGTIKDAEKHDIEINPGKGAIMKGIFYLTKGDVYNIIIGQRGTPPTKRRANPWNGGAGAGGGTFMWKESSIQPLIIAGGGGGQAITGHRVSGYGGNGSLLEEGTMGPTITKDSGIPEPTNIVSNFGKGGSGGGDPGAPGMKSKGWNAIIKEQNMTGVTNRNKSESGFGGGGIMHAHAGGGGGGYSGGGSLRYGDFKSNTMGGGGGGSYFNDDGFKREDSKSLEYNDNDGYLKIKIIKDYFFVEGTKVKCEENGGYKPSTSILCKEGADILGMDFNEGPKENGWNNKKCASNYSRCIWRKEVENLISNCGENNITDKGLIYNDKCKGDPDYETNGIDNVYKTICMTPKKYYENKNEIGGILV